MRLEASQADDAALELRHEKGEGRRQDAAQAAIARMIEQWYTIRVAVQELGGNSARDLAAASN